MAEECDMIPTCTISFFWFGVCTFMYDWKFELYMMSCNNFDMIYFHVAAVILSSASQYFHELVPIPASKRA